MTVKGEDQIMKNNRILGIIIVLLMSLMSYSVLSLTAPVGSLPLFFVIGISAAAGILLGFLLNLLLRRLTHMLKNANFTHLVMILVVFLLSCVMGGFLAIPFSKLPGWLGSFSPLLILGIIFITNGIIFSYRKEPFIELANRLSNGKLQISEVASENGSRALLDTSVIIDGRITDIARCGFVPGTLIVPNFILQELQFIADSEDAQRRQRGRRGLDTLANMQKDKDIDIKIIQFDVPNVREADAKLMHVAMELDCPILTNDYNLNKVAELQGIRILNVNDLTNAVKSILLPGEKLHVNVMQEGKDINQGVGYMEDGTMVVVENGRPFLGQQIEVVVTKILQTAAGRMIFARHEKELGVRR